MKVSRIGLGGHAITLVTGLVVFRIGAVDAQSVSPPITFNDHVEPILLERCASCHRPGGPAPFSLLTYEDVVRRGLRISRAVRSRVMPPWLPDSGYGHFEGERRLTTAEIEIIATWLQGDLTRGKAGALRTTPLPTSEWQLGEPDLMVTVPPFELAPHGTDVYRNLVVPVPLRETRYIKSVELLPGGTQVVHHARLMIDTTRSSRELDAADPGPGFNGMDLLSNAMNPQGFFVGWTPGKYPHESRSGLAWQMDPGTDVVLQVHLPATDTMQVVEPRIGFYFTDSKPDRQPALIMLGSFDIDIPPGDTAYTVSDRYELPIPVAALGVYPHAHYLAKRIEGFATLPTGQTKWLIRISDWDFNWQDEYHFVDPVDLPAGSVITMRITYDNSTNNTRNPNNPPRRVRYGSNSTDEMADLVVQVLPRRPGDLATLQRDLNLWQYSAIVSRIAREEHQKGLDQAAAGNVEGAIAHFREALANKFDEPEIHNDLGVALTLVGSIQDAAAHFREASRLSPGWAEPVANLVRVLLTETGNEDLLAEALSHAVDAVDMTRRADPLVMELLARAQHANGRVPDAIRTAGLALTLAEGQGNQELAQRIRDRMAAWQN